MILITENVDGPEYDALGEHHGLVREPELWRSRSRLEEFAGPEVRAVIVRNRTVVDDAFLDLFPGLEVIGRAGVGLDNIDVAAAVARGIRVAVPFGANAPSVAEHAVMFALALAKNIPGSADETRSGGWNRRANRGLRGKIWGLISVGSTGRATARLARALGMRVIGYDPYLAPEDPEFDELGLTLTGLDEVLAASDVLSVHAPATPATRCMFGADQFRVMKRDAIFINVGRGEVVDEQALIDALAGGEIAGAGLDVRAVEPPEPGVLETLPNVLLTPHVAGITEESQARIAQIICGQIAAVLDGGEPDPAYFASVRSDAEEPADDAAETSGVG